MRLSIEQVEKVSSLILESLKKKELVVFKVDEKAVLKKIADIFAKNMLAEEDLDKEVEKIMQQHSGEIEQGRMDYRKMFSMIKQKVTKATTAVMTKSVKTGKNPRQVALQLAQEIVETAMKKRKSVF